MPKLVLYAAAAIIAAAALPLHYGIYVFIRIIGTITFACLAYESWKQGHELLPWAYGAAAILFNPIIPIHLSKTLWTVIDLAAAAIIFFSAEKFSKKA